MYRKSAAGNVSPCWIDDSNNQAIWWISHLNVWGIGDLNSLGTDIRGITGRYDESDDGIEFGLPTDPKYKWYYWNGGSFEKVSETDDFRISCISFMWQNTCSFPAGETWQNGIFYTQRSEGEGVEILPPLKKLIFAKEKHRVFCFKVNFCINPALF